MLEIWWCVHMQMHHTISTPTRTVMHRGFVESAIRCSLGCSYNPNIFKATSKHLKINIRSVCCIEKGNQNSYYNPNIVCQFPYLWVVLGQLSWASVYGLWCHNNQAQPNLAYNLGTTYHTTYNILPPSSWKEIVCMKTCDICPRMMFSWR